MGSTASSVPRRDCKADRCRRARAPSCRRKAARDEFEREQEGEIKTIATVEIVACVGCCALIALL